MAEKSEIVENLACGNLARDLKGSFIEGYLNSSTELPSPSQGVGGKNDDYGFNEPDIWDQAKSRYYSTLKKTARTKSTEGQDFFATPAPVGLFMTQVARLRPGQSVLEPSCGAGDIAMWIPNNVSLTCIDKSFALMQKAPLRIGRKASFLCKAFEDHHIGQKFNCVLMNPPFRSPADHIEKACRHLYAMGRLVAIVPDSAQMDKRLDNVLARLHDDKIWVNKLREYSLPSATFKRAGTSVKTKIIFLVRTPDPYSQLYTAECKYKDFSHFSSTDELFEGLQSHADIHLNNQHVEFTAAHAIEKPEIDSDTMPVIVRAKEKVIRPEPMVDPANNSQYLLFA